MRRKPGLMREGMVGVGGRGKFGWKPLLVGPWAQGSAYPPRRTENDGGYTL